MISTSTRNDNTTETCKPGPHIDARGKHHPPVGTFYEMLERARYGDSPEPWGIKTQERFVATLKTNPLFREVVRGVLDGE